LRVLIVEVLGLIKASDDLPSPKLSDGLTHFGVGHGDGLRACLEGAWQCTRLGIKTEYLVAVEREDDVAGPLELLGIDIDRVDGQLDTGVAQTAHVAPWIAGHTVVASGT